MTNLQPLIQQVGEALAPFAKTAAVLGDTKDSAVWAGQKPAPPITFGDLRRAAEVYAILTALSKKDDAL